MLYIHYFCKRIVTSKTFFHSLYVALRLIISTILVDLFCHVCWHRIGCSHSWLWISEKAFLLVVMQTLIEWEDQYPVLLPCGCKAHSREWDGKRSARRITSSQFRINKTAKMVIFSITFTKTLLLFPLTWLWKINRKILFAIGMKVNRSTGEIDVFPKHS